MNEKVVVGMSIGQAVEILNYHGPIFMGSSRKPRKGAREEGDK